uniref:Uncharacterized protein n=1 Tax=Adineta vaga TaxID=104782 RepID=B3G4S1_ADIVA|nr:unknown [Adineta vaga]
MTCVNGNCSSWTSISALTICTDYSVVLDVSSGEKSTTELLPLNTQFSITFASSAWFTALVIGGNSPWYVTSRINTMIRPDGLINSSPIAVTLPIIYKQINIQHVHTIQMVDFDRTDILKCRWSSASSNINSYNECGGVCNGVPGATLLISSNCTLQFTLTAANQYAAVAIQIEDYFNSVATTPMSSVPLQFLFYGYAAPSGCNTPPAIIGVRPNRACVGTPISGAVTETIIVQTFCAGTAIIDIISTSPVDYYVNLSGFFLGIYQITLSWTPSASQYGTQGLCAAAVDSSNIQSDQWCIAYLVGITAPQFSQNTASPVGIVYANQTVFSIQADKPVCRPSRNGTYIYFWDTITGGSLIQKFDCGWAPEVTYTGYTITIQFSVAPWITGHSYYITFDSGTFELHFTYISFLNNLIFFIISGVVSGLDSCGK